jgi:hypothetical protein
VLASEEWNPCLAMQSDQFRIAAWNSPSLITSAPM